MQYNWTAADISELERKHPEAYVFLLRRSLEREHEYLEAHAPTLTPTLESRLADLRSIFGETKKDS